MNDLRDVYDSNSNKRILGVTLARGNSKGIKNKNLASISVLKKNKFFRILNNPHKIYLDSGDVLFRKKIH